MERERPENRRGNRRVALAVGAACAVLAAGGYIWHSSQEKEDARYPVHANVVATVFWVGEGADETNAFIHNRSSFWTGDWVGAYGGVDDPEDRCGYRPCEFAPKENPFYAALPYADTQDGVRKPEGELERIPWYDGSVEEGESLIKNRWVAITHSDKTAYAQIQDVGPFLEDDVDYVFGDDPPEDARAGIDLSPATADYLGIDGRGVVSWRFVDEEAVPSGPWRDVVTTSDPRY